MNVLETSSLQRQFDRAFKIRTTVIKLIHYLAVSWCHIYSWSKGLVGKVAQSRHATVVVVPVLEYHTLAGSAEMALSLEGQKLFYYFFRWESVKYVWTVAC